MTKLSLTCILMLFSFIAVADTQILLFSKTEGWRHKAIEPAVTAISAYAEKQGATIVATEDSSVFNEHQLAQFDAVVFLLTTGNILNSKQQQAFEGFIKSGGGFVGVHSATDTEYDWPWYSKLVGGHFAGHPNNPNVRKGKMLIAKNKHIATQMLPSIWQRKDEWYDIKDFNPNVRVLINVDENSYKKPAEGPLKQPRPIAWFHYYDGGKAFYTGLGHTIESYSEPLFMQHLWGGIQSVANTN